MVVFGKCVYCGLPAAFNKQGRWGSACSGCKGALTRMLRSGHYGLTYTKSTKELLKRVRWDWRNKKWILPTAMNPNPVINYGNK